MLAVAAAAPYQLHDGRFPAFIRISRQGFEALIRPPVHALRLGWEFIHQVIGAAEPASDLAGAPVCALASAFECRAKAFRRSQARQPSHQLMEVFEAVGADQVHHQFYVKGNRKCLSRVPATALISIAFGATLPKGNVHTTRPRSLGLDPKLGAGYARVIDNGADVTVEFFSTYNRSKVRPSS